VLTGAARPEFGATQLDPEARRILLPDGAQIDLGGIAKGWIAERAAQILGAYALACAVNAGGDIFMVGLPVGENTWQVTLEDPRDPERGLAVLQLDPGAVATSSISRRNWLQGGRPRHHIIDPRSGEPAETDWLSMTVVAPHATMAEVYAKSLLIAGTAQAEAIAARNGEITFIGVRKDGSLWGSKHSMELIYGPHEFAA
jgi:FAD:protein FMN transferase